LEIFAKAEARARGLCVSSAEPASAKNSLFRDNPNRNKRENTYPTTARRKIINAMRPSFLELDPEKRVVRPTSSATKAKIPTKIIETIRVIWLGGTSLDWPNAGEFNQQQDIAASQILFDSGVELVQIPCHNVASHLKVGVPELRACMGDSDIAKALTDLVAEAIDNNPAKTRVIWDISAIAYVVVPETVRTYKIHSPILHGRPNLTYSADRRRHMIECAYYLDRDAIFIDMYKKIRKLK